MALPDNMIFLNPLDYVLIVPLKFLGKVYKGEIL